ncbi:hypothetical protein JOC75_000541 [Metabacillus crassostreae]|uniref:hypothetical protein n=1 Tax=Metabacillus crassostreae TaxID=929098 RepID=UPI00195E8165|nr:hypothetical protein [Metabacillus crassostreae]MBM7602571.1 hypothetical protein [Metabacillus crassostreae]
MKTENKVATIVVCIMLIVAFIKFIEEEDLWDLNEKRFKEKILSIDESVEKVNLIDVTPFEWDVAYSFNPYTSNEDVYEMVGYKWADITETINEGMNQIVFMKDEEVVCYVYGYPENNGYGLYFNTLMVTSDSQLVFQVDRSSGLNYLYRE